jgi:hypothetical protein
MAAWSGHPAFEGLIYLDKHVQPSTNPCLGDLMTQYYGSSPPNLFPRLCRFLDFNQIHHQPRADWQPAYHGNGLCSQPCVHF